LQGGNALELLFNIRSWRYERSGTRTSILKGVEVGVEEGAEDKMFGAGSNSANFAGP
jgi:hypothetical protein